jgi:hypothetical protein
MNDSALVWDGNWAWSLPLILATVVLHVAGLGVINRGALAAVDWIRRRRNVSILFTVVVGATTLLSTLLHAIEAALWAATYRLLGAVPDGKSALLYSLNAITTYGHSDLYLTAQWRLMGALEALNGMLLFGLTTAFLYGVVQRVWPTHHGANN